MKPRSSLHKVYQNAFAGWVSKKRSILTYIIFFVAVLPQTAFPLKLENDGAYHVVVAIDRKTAKNNIENYVQNIQHGLQRLSDFLHSSTATKFHIKTAEIVLPEHWNFPSEEIASVNYFENADIRISHEFHEPYVYNPKLCGTSGDYIQLPYDFFNVKNEGGHYGSIGRVLLNQWAQYRYGVWEEHGYPLDPNFPYFFKNVSETEWRVNYCANIPLEGEVKTLDGGVCDRRDPDVNPPGYNCRFFPNENKTAPTSSITSFNFMNSIYKFCDNNTHIKNAPNRQNIYCSYRSTTEVIEASSDWESVTEKTPDTPRPIVFKITKMTKKPLLYLVLDGGLTQASELVIEGIKDNLKILVNGSIELPTGVIAAVGSFSADAESNGRSLSEELPWSDIKKSKEDIEKTIDASFSNISGFRDFASAIKEAVDDIKQRQHEFGSVMVIVKTGEATNFDKIYYEDELIAYIKEMGIKIYTFEVEGSPPSLNLPNLALQTGGIHHNISEEAGLEEMRSEMENIAQDLRDFQFTPDKKYKIIFKGVVDNYRNAEILLSVSDVSKLYFHLMPINNKAIRLPVTIQKLADSSFSASLVNKTDWHTNSLAPTPSRKTYNGSFTYNISEPETEYWKVNYACTGDCPSYLFIYGECTTDAEVRSDEIQVFITTSALNGTVDLRNDSQTEAINKFNTPFGIYAKLQHNGFPIKNIGESISVKAIVSLRDSSRYWTVNLLDNGLRIPDITSNDGIFSGGFVPDVNGIFKISVQITTFLALRDDPGDGTSTTVGTSDSGAENSRLHNSERLVSVGQGLIGCGSDFSGCWATDLSFDFMKVVDYTKTVTFVNKGLYIPVPQKILDLKVWYDTGPDATYTIIFGWTNPGVVDTQIKDNRTHEYELVHSESFELLVRDFTAGTLTVPKKEMPYPDFPGTSNTFTKNWGYDTTYYYALRVWDLNYKTFSPPSNIVAITSIEKAPVTIPPATPPTTTTTTSTTTSTTTTTTTSTEPPSTSSTTEKTTTERVTRSTTPRRTTLSTTSTIKPTEAGNRITTSTASPKAASVKHWYKEPSGYVTLSVFAVLFIVVAMSGFGFMWWKGRNMAHDKELFIKAEGPIV